MTAQTPMAKYHHLLMKARGLSYLRGEDADDQAEEYIIAAFRELEKIQTGGLSRIDRMAQNEMLHNARLTLIDGGVKFNIIRETDARELSAIEEDTTTDDWLDKRIMFSTMHPYEDYFRNPPTHIVPRGSDYRSHHEAGMLAVGVTRAMVAARKARIERRLQVLLADANLSNSDQRKFVLGASSVSIEHDGVLKAKYLTAGAFPMTEWQRPVPQLAPASTPQKAITGRTR